MSETLVLLLGHSPNDPIRWGLVADGDIKVADIAPSATELGAVAERIGAGAFVVAVLPGEQAAMRAMGSPPSSASKFRAAATYLLEDELAESCETLHVTVSRRSDSSGIALAVKKNLLFNWISILEEHGLSPDLITADFALLPADDGRAIIVFEANRISGIIGFDGFAAERALADSFLDQLIADGPIEDLTAIGDGQSERTQIAGQEIEWLGASDVASLLGLYADRAKVSSIPNLRDREFRKRHDWQGAMGAWRQSAALAAACFALLFVLAIADGARQLRIAHQFESEMTSLHREAFPANADSDPRRHARAILSSGTGAMQFLSLSTGFAESLEENGGIVVDRIRFNRDRGEFAISLRFSDINDLEQLKQLLANKGIAADETGGVRRSGGFYVGELRVGGS